MSRVLTGLAPKIFAALNVVSREVTAYTRVVSRNSDATRVAVGTDVVIPVAQAVSAYNIVAKQSTPETDEAGVENRTIKITKSKGYPITLNGEDTLNLETGGILSDVTTQEFQNAFRVLGNEIEADIFALRNKAGAGAIAYSGSEAFENAVKDSALARKLLTDAGSPLVNLQLVTDTLGGANIRSNSNLSRASEANSDKTLREGELLRLNGFNVAESFANTTVAKGDASATTTDAGFAVGSKVIDTTISSGSFLEGDVVTFAGDENRYVIQSISGAKITLANPLKKAIPAAATAITIVTQKTPSLVFPSQAIALVTRAPALPSGGDSATDRMQITDPNTGLVFEVAVYKGYKQNLVEVSIAWGVEAVNPQFLGLIV